MRVSRQVLFGIGLAAAFGCVSEAQVSQVAPAPVPPRVVQGGWFFSGPMGSLSSGPVTGAPYSADQTTEHVQTLADGTHITQTIVGTKLYRDGMGRSRTERTISPNGQSTAVVFPAFIDIFDPVAGYHHYVLNPRNHTARRLTWSQA